MQGTIIERGMLHALDRRTRAADCESEECKRLAVSCRALMVERKKVKMKMKAKRVIRHADSR